MLTTQPETPATQPEAPPLTPDELLGARYLEIRWRPASGKQETSPVSHLRLYSVGAYGWLLEMLGSRGQLENWQFYRSRNRAIAQWNIDLRWMTTPDQWAYLGGEYRNSGEDGFADLRELPFSACPFPRYITLTPEGRQLADQGSPGEPA